MRTEVRIAGFGGQGVIMAGVIIGKAASLFDNKNSLYNFYSFHYYSTISKPFNGRISRFPYKYRSRFQEKGGQKS